MEKLTGKRLFMLAFGIMMSLVVFGQQVRVSGTVVNVVVRGSLTGAITGINGEYYLMAAPGDVLVFTFIGYLPQEITVGNQTVINAALLTDVKALDEVVVIGYGTVRKEDATGSVRTVNSEQLNPGLSSAPSSLIVGKMAGVQVTTSSGAPGEGAQIRIRGGSSLRASNDPLIVIDGVPMDLEGPSGMRASIGNINSNDIASFTVLKDASATAIYGSRASNGVILITTKKGTTGQPFRVHYTGSASLSTAIKFTDVFTAAEFTDLIQTKYESNAQAQALLGDANTDWQSEIYQQAWAQDHNLSFSGGVKNLPYRASIGYTNQDGILKTDNLERVTLAVNLNPTFFDDHLKVDLSAKGMLMDNRFANRGAIGGALSMDPTQTTDFLWKNPDGSPLFVAPMNPLVQLSDYNDVADVNRLLGNLSFEYKMHFFPALKAKLNVGLDRSVSEGSVEIPVGSFLSYSTYQGKGRLTEYDQNKTNSLLDFYFDYTGEFGDHSRLNAVLGYSWQHFYRQGKTNTTSTDGFTLYEKTDYESENYLVSFFGRANYVLYDKYLFTFTLRDDGSSRFSPETRWGLFPSAAFAWNIAKEGFFGDKVLSNLKLRLGYGITGQQNLSNDDYPYQAIYTFADPGAYYPFGNVFMQTARAGGYDANLKWEETTTYNVGLDYGFLKDRITGDLDVYYRETKDLINQVPVPAGTNLTNQIVTNVGNLENRGLEFSINAKVIASNDFDWELGFNATYNVNKITKLTLVDDPDYKGIYVGGIGGGVGNTIQIHSVGYPSYAFYVQEQVYDADGKPIEGLYVDRNNDGAITGDDRYRYQKPAPTLFMGFSSMFRYKNFDFTFNGRINLDNYVYNNVYAGATYANMAASGYLSNRVTNVLDSGFENSQYYSDYYMENGSFLKLDNLALGYNFNNIGEGSIDIRLFGTVQNLFTITKYRGLDPEEDDGIDNNTYPRPRIFQFGVSVTL
ncbi:MAG: TonB-dependent receptor [Bacteroidales bacterium]|nr:TonB-dependent receptor [Bacteroidales bacterium]